MLNAYAQNYAGIIGWSLILREDTFTFCWFFACVGSVVKLTLAERRRFVLLCKFLRVYVSLVLYISMTSLVIHILLQGYCGRNQFIASSYLESELLLESPVFTIVDQSCGIRFI